jgi:transcriptional regulator with XRE-family HTH domain
MQLGDVTRIHQSFVSEIERGVGLPTPDQAQRLARALDVPVETLLQPVEIVAAPVAVADRG